MDVEHHGQHDHLPYSSCYPKERRLCGHELRRDIPTQQQCKELQQLRRPHPEATDPTRATTTPAYNSNI